MSMRAYSSQQAALSCGVSARGWTGAALPFGVISGAHYTGLNINTAVWRGENLEFAREIQEITVYIF